eukprot:481713_1
MVQFWLWFLTIFCIPSLTQVPPQDQCQFINQTEPPQCPQTIGPPCPPCIINSYSDYKPGDSLVISPTTRQNIESYMNQYTNFWLINYPPSTIIPATQPSNIVNGAAGRSLLFLRMFNYTHNISYLNIATEYINNAINSLNLSGSNQVYPSYFGGPVGVYVVAAQIAKFKNNTNNIQIYLNKIQDIFKDVNTAINNNLSLSPKYGYDMFDAAIASGLGGLLYVEMLIIEYFGLHSIPNITKYISNLSHYLIDIGLKRAKEMYNVNYLIYQMPWNHQHNHTCYLSGAADGIGGVVKMLLEAYNRGYVPDLMVNNKYKTAITNTLNWEVSIQLNDGNMPTYSNDIQSECSDTWAGNDSNARVQWCNGAPSFIEIYGLAASVYDSIGDNTSAKIYLTAALKAFNATWNRGLLIKGLMQCHGIGGNTYTLLHLYKNLEVISKRSNSVLNEEFNITYLMNQSLWRAIQFIEFTLNENNLNALRTKYSNEDYSMWSGSYGINVLYIQAIQDGWPQKQPVCMIAWDLCGV